MDGNNVKLERLAGEVSRQTNGRTNERTNEDDDEAVEDGGGGGGKGKRGSMDGWPRWWEILRSSSKV